MKDTRSERTPGYSFRRMDAEKNEKHHLDNVHVYDVQQDGERGIDVRSATADDAKRRGKTKRSPLV
ncbi:hypothetical protein LLE49_01830 [Alicyclobacillus tolerans]|uniref:hypothetical protein n=1 Tax=Alicyclobacillus tolerans TaxID=90970 RepID=UPI001F4371F3|nr:hypothetical protein [Alicyclobacillus tolerans]MCF8563482.1 hypothetical protein [Alicyclobacillus tolerans]